jgi:5-(carboxyamino)imidazole ribonucleotide mutase
MGSEKDIPHSEKITKKLDELGVAHESHVASAHKTPLKALKILEDFKGQKKTVFITIAGRSNALSGFCAGNTTLPVIACPPFADKVDMMVNINSTIQMPSNVPVMTVLDPENTAIACYNILNC